MSDKLRKVVVLDRVRPDWTPPYCIHGRATCFVCGRWCWLGSETYEPVAARRLDPICLDCIKRVYPKGISPLGHIRDHRRADGPHG